jgi:UDP-N-acetylmuramate--alanine ligase
MEEAFVKFANQLKPGELLLTKFGLPEKEFSSSMHLHYSLLNDAADIYASNIRMRDGGYEFDVKAKDWELEKVKLNMGGMHNVENAVAAISIASYLKIAPIKIINAVGTFKGVKRRFEYIINSSEAAGNKNNVVFIDDYAHHPAELGALIRSAKSLFSFKKCTVIFQPHLFSRTKDFSKEFAESLDMADRILLLPIYPARELPVEGVTSELILKEMKNKNATVISKEELLNYIRGNYLKSVHESSYGEVLITAGAGDIDKLVQPIKEILLRTF